MTNPADPNWDYAQSWRYIEVLPRFAQELKQQVANTPVAAPNLEKELEQKLLMLRNCCDQAIACLPSQSFFQEEQQRQR